MTKTRKLEVLQSLADMQRQAALADLAALRRKETEAQASRHDLTLRRSQAITAACAEPELGTVVTRFDSWISQQQAALQARLATIADEVAVQKAVTARYFGRAEALKSLREQEFERARASLAKRV